MDISDFLSGRSPRRELQGPRPAPLRVHKDSHKIKKPPMPPHQSGNHHPQATNAPPRPPVIIYTVSPKIIHANPTEFMSLVQRLTGPNSNCPSSSSVMNAPSTSSSHPAFAFDGSLSPAARFASIEKTNSPVSRKSQVLDYNVEINLDGVEIGYDIQRTGQLPSILSPNPNTLPPIPSIFFSPPPNSNSNSNPFAFFNDFSPTLYSNNRNQENNFSMPSPFFSPQINMPSPNTLDLFNTLFDL